MNSQTDILELVKWLRIFKFVTMVTLKKNQVHAIKYSNAYCLKQGEQDLAAHNPA